MPPKRKGKGRAAAEPTSHDELMEAASYQEDQAIRYQFGDKAQRHYEEAARLYGAALQVPAITPQERYDAKYNLARVLYALATEIYGLPKCYDSLLQAIEAFRACGEYSVSDRTDAAFNLAQALQTLGEYVSESVPSSSIHRSSTPASIWAEAVQILSAIQQEQTFRLQATNNADSENVEDEKSESDVTSSMEAAAVEEQIVTPSTVIETILASIQAHLSIAESTRHLDEAQLASLLQAAVDLDAAGSYMAMDIRSAKEEIVKTGIRLQLERGEAPDIHVLQHVIEQQRQSISSLRRPDPAALSDLADTLMLAAEVMLSSTTRRESAAQSSEALREAVALYDQARLILGNPLQRPGSTLGHHVPALLSANCQSCAQAYILLALLESANGQSGQNSLAKARELALEGLNRTEGSFKALPPADDGPVKFAKNLRSAQRDDYRTVSATRDAVLTIARIFLLERLLQGGSQQFGEQERGLHALLKATWPDANDLKHVIEEFVGDFQTDGVGRLLQRWFNLSEQTVWSAFVNASL